MTALASRVAAPAGARRWWVLATMTGSLSMIMIDRTVVSVALPTMQHDLSLSTAGVQWVVNAYLLLLAVFVALGGRIADLLGPERTFRAGAGLFVVSSALRGLATGEAGILAARGLQGIGAALMVPSTSALILGAFDVRERGKAMGIYTGISMVFLALGPLFGGLLTQGVSWRAVFFINLPIGVAILVASCFTLAHDPRPRIARDAIDRLGIPLLIVAPLAGRLYDRIGPRPLLATGSALIGLGLAWHLPEHDYTVLIGGYVAMGAGIGMTISPATTDALGAAAVRERSQASGMLQTVRQVGGVIGIAVLGAIVSHVSAVAPNPAAAVRVSAATDGVAAAYWTGAGVMAVMALVAWSGIRRRP